LKTQSTFLPVKTYTLEHGSTSDHITVKRSLIRHVSVFGPRDRPKATDLTGLNAFTVSTTLSNDGRKRPGLVYLESSFLAFLLVSTAPPVPARQDTPFLYDARPPRHHASFQVLCVRRVFLILCFFFFLLCSRELRMLGMQANLSYNLSAITHSALPPISEQATNTCYAPGRICSPLFGETVDSPSTIASHPTFANHSSKAQSANELHGV